MLHIRPMMLAAALLTTACGPGPGGAPVPGPLPNNNGDRGNANPNSPTDANDPNKLDRSLITNNVQLSLQESADNSTKRTAAISCSYSSFSGQTMVASDIYSLHKPQRATCHYGYKKHTANQTVPDYQAPSSLIKMSPDFPASLDILPLVAIGGQNTSGIAVSIPTLPVINTNSCHSAELRLFSRGTFKNYKLTRNKTQSSYFDLNSTDFSNEFARYTHDMISGYFRDNTHRDPVEVIYLCDWNESSSLADEAIGGLDDQIATRTGAAATWSLQIFNGDTLLKSLDKTDAKTVYEVFAKHYFDRSSSWTAKITARGKDGVVLATNDQEALSNDPERNFWSENCSTIEPSLKFEKQQDYSTILALNICDLSKVLRTTGVSTPVADPSPARKHYVAPVHCKVSKMVSSATSEIATGYASRQVCDFALPALMPTLPEGSSIGVLQSWKPSTEILDVTRNGTEVANFDGEKVVLNLRKVSKFNNINLYDCRQAVLTFKTAEGGNHSVVMDTARFTNFSDKIVYSRSTSMSANEEIAAAGALKGLYNHLRNTANSHTEMDIYLMCNWWALPGEKVTTL